LDSSLMGLALLKGTTALHVAARENRCETMLHLMEQYRAPLDAQDLAGRTPLHYAAEEGHIDVCKVWPASRLGLGFMGMTTWWCAGAAGLGLD
jgi:hypothetical protein